MTNTLSWSFPLPRTHTGVPLGNARTGLLVWGDTRTLRITIGRADLWDHRGGMPWTADQNYRAIRECLEAGDEAGIRTIFRPATEGRPGVPARPSVVPVGRIDLTLARGCTLEGAELSLRDGSVSVWYSHNGAPKRIEIGLHPRRDVAWLCGTSDVEAVSPVTSWDIFGERLASLSFTAPERFTVGADVAGWHWQLPADPGVSVAWRTSRDAIVMRVDRFAGAFDASVAAPGTGVGDGSDSVGALRAQTRAWWAGYWDRVAAIDLPNPTLQEIHDFGLYCFAGLTNPAGVAATLQGPWIEEYDFPPWSSDYHFNINVQMCYSPAFRCGALDHLVPLFDLVWSWRDQLRQNARHFVGIDDGYMLPHAVDDRCTCMGSFWTGTIDHACTAWVAQMMYDYADYTGDIGFLRERAYPFMQGTLAVYRAMLEDDGDMLKLPVSVSPEYRGSAMNAWGANASFQLAAIRRLCENLLAAAATLGVRAEPAWADILTRLPAAALVHPTTGEGPSPDARPPEDARIALWEGVDLEESHRHHSHLAGIAPFDTIDIDEDAWRPVVANSLRHWIETGMGLWSGWCMSWASQLHSRIGNGDGAQLLLEIWRRVFTNQGRASMHDAVLNGVTLMGAPPIVGPGGLPSGSAAPAGSRDGATGAAILQQAERMQTDGAMGGVAAVQEMVFHSRRGVLRVFPAIPSDWDHASFSRMHAPGGFIVDGWWNRDEGWRVEVDARRGGRLRIAGPTPEATVRVHRRDESVRGGGPHSPSTATEHGPIVEIDTEPGDRIEIVGRVDA